MLQLTFWTEGVEKKTLLNLTKEIKLKLNC